MQRITKDDLERRVAYLNRITGHPEKAYVRDTAGVLHINTGTYLLDGAYGGYQLHRIVEGGGHRNLFDGGYLTKRDLFNRLNAFIQGFEASNE